MADANKTWQDGEIDRLKLALARAWTIANERGKVIDQLQKELEGLYVGAGCNRRPRGKDVVSVKVD